MSKQRKNLFKLTINLSLKQLNKKPKSTRFKTMLIKSRFRACKRLNLRPSKKWLRWNPASNYRKRPTDREWNKLPPNMWSSWKLWKRKKRNNAGKHWLGLWERKFRRLLRSTQRLRSKRRSLLKLWNRRKFIMRNSLRCIKRTTKMKCRKSFPRKAPLQLMNWLMSKTLN